jgi:hypothetical protein
MKFNICNFIIIFGLLISLIYAIIWGYHSTENSGFFSLVFHVGLIVIILEVLTEIIFSKSNEENKKEAIK